MAYQPFPIADFRSGLELAKEPFISLPNGFRTMENGFPFRGRIWKRWGYTNYGELGYAVFDEAPGTGNAEGTSGAPYTETIANVPVVKKQGATYKVLIEDTTAHTGAAGVTDDGAGLLVHSGDGTVGTINYETGAIVINALSVAFDSNVQIDYEYRKQTAAGGTDTQNAVMGLDSYFDLAGSETPLAFDRRRIWRWDPTDERYEPDSYFEWNTRGDAQQNLDLFTVEPSDFPWVEWFDDNTLVTNGVDPIIYFDGTNWSEINTDMGSPTNVAPDLLDPAVSGDRFNEVAPYSRDIDAAALAYRYKERCILLDTTESSNRHPQRARWSIVAPLFAAGATSDWNVNDWRDAPTVDFIVSSSFLADHLIVFFERSVWRLLWKDDVRDPFEWEKIADTDGSFAKMSTVDFTDELLTVGPTSLIGCDGQDVYEVGDEIPDFLLDWNLDKFQFSFGAVVEETRQTWWSYAKQAEDYPNMILVQNYEDVAFGTMDIAPHCIGYTSTTSTKLWDDIDTDWDDTFFGFDDRISGAGFPSTLLGMRTLKILEMNTAFDDDGTDITFKIKTQRFNPWSSSGDMQRARLGYVDIIGSAPAEVTITARFYKDFEDAPYHVTTFDLLPDSAQDKQMTRLLVNQVGRYHQVELEETSGVPLFIDAIIPHMAPAGGIRGFDN